MNKTAQGVETVNFRLFKRHDFEIKSLLVLFHSYFGLRDVYILRNLSLFVLFIDYGLPYFSLVEGQMIVISGEAVLIMGKTYVNNDFLILVND